MSSILPVRAAARPSVVATVLLWVVATLTLTGAGTADGAVLRDPAVGATDLTGFERRLLSWTNAVREREGLRPLRHDPGLSRYAARHSHRMADRRQLSHSSGPAISDALGGTGWSTWGENVGMGPSLGSVQRAFLRSDGHRANLLGRSFDHVGVGVAVRNGTVWVTIVFYG